MSRVTLAVTAAVLCLSGTIACGKGASEEERMVVRGTVSQELATTPGARAVAVGENGHTIWTTLDGRKDFTLKLSVGQSYRILITNPRPSGGQQVAGHLVLRRGAAASRWVAAKQAITVDLGSLTPALTTTTATSGVNTLSGTGEMESEHEDGDDDANEHDDDDDSHESESSDVCSAGGSEVELQASSPPGAEAEDDGEHAAGAKEHEDDCESESESEADDD